MTTKWHLSRFSLYYMVWWVIVCSEKNPSNVQKKTSLLIFNQAFILTHLQCITHHSKVSIFLSTLNLCRNNLLTHSKLLCVYHLQKEKGKEIKLDVTSLTLKCSSQVTINDYKSKVISVNGKRNFFLSTRFHIYFQFTSLMDISIH